MLISVAVPTCNRPEDLERCLASLEQVRYTGWRLIVVDQSDDDRTRRLADQWGTRIPQITYLHAAEKNLSAARNLAIQNATGEVLVFIDDDCTVGSDWLDRVREAFEREPEASLIFGAVIAAEHDSAVAFVPSHDLRHERRLRGSLGALRMRALMGANMCIRLGSSRRPSFDVLLGAGARFRSSEEWDYVYRALFAGALVLETPDVVVTHHGARTYASGASRSLVRGYLYGIGASHAKLLRCGDWVMVAVVVERLGRSIAWIRPLNAFNGKPTRLGGLLMYLRGLRDGLKIPVDREAGVYRVALQLPRVAHPAGDTLT